jgi:hypothetical protein
MDGSLRAHSGDVGREAAEGRRPIAGRAATAAGWTIRRCAAWPWGRAPAALHVYTRINHERRSGARITSRLAAWARPARSAVNGCAGLEGTEYQDYNTQQCIELRNGSDEIMRERLCP